MRFKGAALALALMAGCPAEQAEAQDEVSGTLLVANKRGNSLSRIDLASGAETHRADTCENPHELTVSPDRQSVLVACYSGRTLEIYDTGDLSRERTIELGERARVHSAIWIDESRIVAGAEGRGSLYAIELVQGAEPRLVEIGGGGPGPHLLAVDDGGAQAWGTIIPLGTVVRYELGDEGGTEAVRRVVGAQTEALALSPDGSSLWVGSNSENKVYRLDPETLETLAEVEVGTTPIRLAAHPGGRWVATSNFGSGDISVIDAESGKVARTIAVSGSGGAAQVTLVFSEDGSRLYAAETAADRIAEIDFESGEVLRRLPTGEGGDGLAVFE